MFLTWEEGRPLGPESCLNDCRSFEEWECLGSVGEEELAFVYRYGVHFKHIFLSAFVTEKNNERECSTLQEAATHHQQRSV
jgi:hypothetical protein